MSDCHLVLPCLPQTDVNEKMRAILVDWLVEVHLKFKVRPATLLCLRDACASPTLSPVHLSCVRDMASTSLPSSPLLACTPSSHLYQPQTSPPLPSTFEPLLHQASASPCTTSVAHANCGTWPPSMGTGHQAWVLAPSSRATHPLATCDGSRQPMQAGCCITGLGTTGTASHHPWR